jgi:hypothetical protein
MTESEVESLKELINTRMAALEKLVDEKFEAAEKSVERTYSQYVIAHQQLMDDVRILRDTDIKGLKEKDIRELQEWKSNFTGRFAVVVFGIPFVISLLFGLLFYFLDKIK